MLSTAAIVLTGMVVAAPAASAAPACTKTVYKTRGDLGASVPASSSGSLSCVMGQGSTGAPVRRLQHALSICHGLDVGSASGSGDGIYGPMTANAVRTVQRRNGLTVDGVYGPQTRRVILWRMYGGMNAKCLRAL